MKITLLLSLVLLCACEAKKSSGSFGRPVERRTTSPLGEPTIPSFETATVPGGARNECTQRAIDVALVSENSIALTQSEVVSGERAYAELKSIVAVITDRSGAVRLVETRHGNRYVQSCKNLSGVEGFNLRYAAPKFFSLEDGNFGKRNGSDAKAMRYRVQFDPARNATRVAAFIDDSRLRGTIQQDLVAQLPELANSEIHFFRSQNTEIEIRVRKEEPTLGLALTFSARYEIKH